MGSRSDYIGCFGCRRANFAVGDYLSGERVYYVAALNINPASKRRAHHLSTEARRRIPAENDMMLNSTIEYVTLWIN
ncbi:5268_t:CDS:2 [Funneliformis geosporum]|uniref:5268_t:CDS:1 n=1 Tax=Funneliformis geosporum TaxID=1117311 RepID=A0A9W4SE39_9GLOM|nr:5268_t:CDS:2 [Funneliformis geosporum]